MNCFEHMDKVAVFLLTIAICYLIVISVDEAKKR